MKDQIDNLMLEAEGLPYGFAKADLVREAIRLADLSKDKELQFATREEFLSASNFAGLHAEMLVTFTWLLNHLDDYPDGYEWDLLWQYKWVITSAYEFPEFSAEQITYFHEDARKRYLSYAGLTSRTIDYLDVGYETQKGNYDKARTLMQAVTKAPRDAMADCIACEVSNMARNWFDIGDVDEAIRLHEDCITTGKACAEEPAQTNVRATLYYATVGDWEKAEQAHIAGYPKTLKSDNISMCCSHYSLCYKVLAGDLDGALSVFDEHLTPILRTRNLKPAFEFYWASHYLFNRLKSDGVNTVKIRSSNQIPLPNQNGEFNTDDLIEWTTKESTDIALKFDKRNGCSHFQDRMKLDWSFGPRPLWWD